tara:strand:+ start:183 stop:323 length:141 start_codon:yes stop_codon:yes gene_type:complete
MQIVVQQVVLAEQEQQHRLMEVQILSLVVEVVEEHQLRQMWVELVE